MPHGICIVFSLSSQEDFNEGDQVEVTGWTESGRMDLSWLNGKTGKVGRERVVF